MEKDLKELIKEYEEELRSVQEDFQPCAECCDLTALRTKEYELNRVIKDLKYLVG